MPLSGDSTVLVPVDVSVSEAPDEALLELLHPVDVVVLGYYTAPEQTTPAQLKTEHEATVAARLDDIVAQFDTADHAVEGVLVFTNDRQDSIDRVADQHDCEAVLVPGTPTAVERILVPLRGDVNLNRIVSLVADLARESEASIRLLHAVDPDTDPSRGELLLRGAVDQLADEGVDRDRLSTNLSESADPRAEIVELADDHDLIVLGETEPSLRERIMGTRLNEILDAVDAHAVVVRDTD